MRRWNIFFENLNISRIIIKGERSSWINKRLNLYLLSHLYTCKCWQLWFNLDHVSWCTLKIIFIVSNLGSTVSRFWFTFILLLLYCNNFFKGGFRGWRIKLINYISVCEFHSNFTLIHKLYVIKSTRDNKDNYNGKMVMNLESFYIWF